MENPNSLEQKVDLMLELLRKQEDRAKRAVFWKFLWIFLLIILPMYFSYKMLSGIDFGSMGGMLQQVQSLQGMIPTQSNTIDTQSTQQALEYLKSLQQ